MKQKKVTKTFVVISNWKNTVHALKHPSADVAIQNGHSFDTPAANTLC